MDGRAGGAEGRKSVRESLYTEEVRCVLGRRVSVLKQEMDRKKGTLNAVRTS